MPALDDVNAASHANLATRRTVMAAERTLMAWIRTALAMISFGFTIGKLGDALSSAKLNLFGRPTDIVGLAYFLVVVGTTALVLATIQHRIEMRELLPSGVTRRPSLAVVIAVLLSLLGIFVFADLVTRF